MRKGARLSHGRQAVRNFILLALMIAACWALFQAPLWLLEYRITQGAEQKVEILWRGNLDAVRYGGAGAPPTGGIPMVVSYDGADLRWGYMGSYEGDVYITSNAVYPLESDEPQVISSIGLGDIGFRNRNGFYLLTVLLPDSAVRGEVQITAQTGETYLVSAQRDMDMIWFPLLVEDSIEPHHHFINATYTLSLFDKADTVLGTWSGLL